MQSFKEFLLEDIEPMPKKAGWVNYRKIGGNHVHVRFYHRGGGKYVPTVHVNDSVHKEKDLSPDVNMKIASFVNSSTKEFKEKIKPTKIKIRANSQSKAAIYAKWAKSEVKKTPGVTAVGKRSTLTVDYPQNRGQSASVPRVKYDEKNPAHGKKEQLGKWDKHKPGDYKLKKKKWNWPSPNSSPKAPKEKGGKGGKDVDFSGFDL